ncbi:hypothetical protein OHS18_38265 [Amycolatopsis sp. NBC_00355]|uniref:hypothetical protein n=1 Tax=Amycolatopsis sp. NBC_00355 TaxID=2975957 RepID=UPI002E26CAC2
MSEVGREAIIVVTQEDLYNSTLSAVRRGGHRVVSELPPTLATAVFSESGFSAPGAQLFFDTVPLDVVNRLDARSRLFVGAWQAGKEPKTRPGDGLSWDAPGFTPPGW